jgi:hypothetical protein
VKAEANADGDGVRDVICQDEQRAAALDQIAEAEEPLEHAFPRP